MTATQRTRQTLDCYFCGALAANTEVAIDLGWVPSFYEAGSDGETLHPCCGKCVAKHLEYDEDGELVRVTD
jgi:homoaconitase/3-isopropylmalate dehydratase large subunit